NLQTGTSPSNPNPIPETELVFDTSFPDGGIAAKQAVFNRHFEQDFPAGSPIIDAVNNTNGDIFTPTDFKLNIPQSAFTDSSGTLNALTDFDVGVAFTHPDLQQVSVQLIFTPSFPGDPTRTITLVRNKIDNKGQSTTPSPNPEPFTFGLGGTNGLGILDNVTP